MTNHFAIPQKKVFGVPLQKSLVKGEDGSVLVRGFFTSDRMDEVGDVITRVATEAAIPKYRTWGNIRLMHQPIPVGKVTRIGAEDGLEWNEVEIKVIDPQAVFMVEQGLLQALSVGILINFEDIEEMADGGWKINNYQLAEISLVDHPANYDAALKELPVRGNVRALAREYGLDFVARGLLALKELPMEPEIKETPAEETPGAADELPVADDTKSPACQQDGESVEDCVGRKIPEIMGENPDMTEEEAAAMAQEMCGKPCTEEEPAAEDADVESEISETASEEPETAEQISDRLVAAVDALSAIITEFTDRMNAMLERMEQALSASEAPVEAPTAEAQAEGDEVKELPAAVEELEPELPGPVVNRTGAVQGTVAPDEKTIQPEGTEVGDLKDALRKYFTR